MDTNNGTVLIIATAIKTMLGWLGTELLVSGTSEFNLEAVLLLTKSPGTK
jgi:hypothetical protein